MLWKCIRSLQNTIHPPHQIVTILEESVMAVSWLGLACMNSLFEHVVFFDHVVVPCLTMLLCLQNLIFQATPSFHTQASST